MKKSFFATALLTSLLLTTPSFAAETYKDSDSGFSLKLPDNKYSMAGENFYGIFDYSGLFQTHMFVAIDSDKIEEKLGNKLTAIDFKKKVEEVKLLERNNLLTTNLKKDYLDPTFYSEFSIIPKKLLNGKESITTEKIKGKDFIVINTENETDEKKDLFAASNTKIALTVANDNLYALVSILEKPRISDGLSEDRKEWHKKRISTGVEKHNKWRKDLLNGLKLFVPTAKEETIRIADDANGEDIVIPNTWLYARGKDFLDDGEKCVVAFAMPEENFKKIQERALDTSKEEYSKAVNSAASGDAENYNMNTLDGFYNSMGEFILAASYKPGKYDELKLNKLMEEINENKADVEKILNDFRNEKGKEVYRGVLLRDFTYLLSMDPELIDLASKIDVTLMKRYDFSSASFVKLTKEKGHGMIYVSKGDGFKTDLIIKKYFPDFSI